jgi:hypothetical protein
MKFAGYGFGFSACVSKISPVPIRMGKSKEKMEEGGYPLQRFFKNK